jgi:hypothetical protein
MTTDRMSAGVLALFALFVIFESRQLPLGTFRHPGPGYVPVLLASLLLLFAVLILLTASRSPKLSSLHWSEWRHGLAIFASCVFCVFAIERLGYRLTMVLMLAFLVKLIEKRGWILSLIFSCSLSWGSYFLFYTLLRVPLPQGPLGF